jgi:CubicO group peptidase (beta-lactamase class C family)
MKKLILLLAIISVVIVSCSSSSSVQYTYSQPKEIQDGFEVGSLSDVNLDEDLLGKAIDEIRNGKYGELHSILIYKDGKLVLEEYFAGHEYDWDGPNFHGAWVNWNIESRHNIHSLGKSITSTCVGIAIDGGFIESMSQSIFDYLPEHQQLNINGKNEITIEHLVTMSSGLEWNEWGTSYSDGSNDVIALWLDCADPITCILEAPLINEPGTEFTYSGGNTVVLGEIIKNATGVDIETFSWQYLFEPMGIETPPWQWIGNTGVVFAAADQRLTSREMLKYGVMYLDQGFWNRKQIVSEEWVENSISPYSGSGNTWFNHFLRPIPPGSNAWGSRGYSYGWWTHEFSGKIPSYFALGFGGQKIIIFPNHKTVVVFTAGNYTSADTSEKILTKYVIPALE